MLAPFPRTSVYPTIMPRVQKNNKKLGKVSHQMQKIIDDIQGKRSEDVKCRDFHTADEGQRKRASLREREDPSRQDRRYQRRKSRRTRDYNNKLRETACQTTMLEGSQDFGQSDGKRLKHTNKNCQPLEITSGRQVKKINLTNNESGSQEEARRMNNKYLKAKAGICGDAIAPWMRPLPPVPEQVYQKSKSQAHVYQKVFETLKARMKVEKIENIPENAWTSLSFSPSKSLSERTGESESTKEFSRYVDIDVISEEKTKPQIIQFNREQISPESDKRLADHGEYDEDHIYESIDENSDCEDNHKLSNCRELFPNEDTPASVHLLPNLLSQRLATPFSLELTFCHEDTYLQPVFPQELPDCKNTSEGNVELTRQGQSTLLYTSDKIPDFNVCSLEVSSIPICTRHEITNDSPDRCCSDEYPNVQCPSCSTDFQYSRDYAGSPTWSNNSPQHEILPLKATYV